MSNPDINCKKWWSIVNRVCGRENSSSIPPIVENEVTIFDSKEKTCIFNEYFVFQSELPVVNAIPPAMQPYQTQRFLSHIIATEEQVLELMKGVDISKACGYDGVGNKIIKSYNTIQYNTIIYLTTLTSKSTKCSFKIRTCIKLSKIHIHMKY